MPLPEIDPAQRISKFHTAQRQKQMANMSPDLEGVSLKARAIDLGSKLATAFPGGLDETYNERGLITVEQYRFSGRRLASFVLSEASAFVAHKQGVNGYVGTLESWTWSQYLDRPVYDLCVLGFRTLEEESALRSSLLEQNPGDWPHLLRSVDALCKRIDFDPSTVPTQNPTLLPIRV